MRKIKEMDGKGKKREIKCHDGKTYLLFIWKRN